MMKRYEQIISASVEELARFLVRLSENEREFNYCRNLPECMAMADSGGEIPQEKCVGCMMRWLKEEATAERLEERGKQMPEYIAKGKAKEAVDSAVELSKSEYDMMCDAINQIPAADVAPVVHGRWEGWITPAFYGLDDFGEPIYRDAAFYRCSICSRKSAIKEKFCPSCGAMMD